MQIRPQQIDHLFYGFARTFFFLNAKTKTFFFAFRKKKVRANLKEVAEAEDYDYVFDRSGDIMILFAKEKYDLTSQVLEKLKLK